MIFHFDTDKQGRNRIFSFIVNELDFERDGIHAKRFVDYLLSNMANMIAGWYFRNHKEEFSSWLNSEECKKLVAEILANKIELQLKNELANRSDKTTR